MAAENSDTTAIAKLEAVTTQIATEVRDLEVRVARLNDLLFNARLGVREGRARLAKASAQLVARRRMSNTPARVREVADLMDRFSVPLRFGVADCGDALRRHGHGRRYSIVAAARRFRLDREALE